MIGQDRPGADGVPRRCATATRYHGAETAAPAGRALSILPLADTENRAETEKSAEFAHAWVALAAPTASQSPHREANLVASGDAVHRLQDQIEREAEFQLADHDGAWPRAPQGRRRIPSPWNSKPKFFEEAVGPHSIGSGRRLFLHAFESDERGRWAIACFHIGAIEIAADATRGAIASSPAFGIPRGVPRFISSHVSSHADGLTFTNSL